MERSVRGFFWWFYPVGLIVSGAVLGWGIYLNAQGKGVALLAAGCVGVVATVLVGLLAVAVADARRVALRQMEELLSPVQERLQQLSVLLNVVSEQQLISERAKAIAFRDSERDALRRAIREEMGKRDYDAAMTLADEIEAVFGYKQEADKLRSEIQIHRDGEVRRLVNDAMGAIERYSQMEQWTFAMREAERVMALFPADEQAQRLAQEVENRRQRHKQSLLTQWNDAVTRHDIDGSIQILKNLDLYLTPQEAAAMQDAARQVFKDKLLLLGQQFTLAVKEHRWPESIRLGEAIAGEFPNSRMAQEVKDKMDLLRQRAAEGQAVGVR